MRNLRTPMMLSRLQASSVIMWTVERYLKTRHKAKKNSLVVCSGTELVGAIIKAKRKINYS